MSAKRMVDADDLITGSEIASLLGVVPGAVGNWRKRHADFPKSVSEGSPIFLRSEVADWARRHIDIGLEIERAEARIRALQRLRGGVH